MLRRLRPLHQRVVIALGLVVFAISAAAAATLGGVTLPDTQMVGGTQLRLNGIALRTYSILQIRIYVAGLYLEQPSHDGAAILASPEKKMLVVHFIRDVDAEAARKAWIEGFEGNCIAPCRMDPVETQRFLASVPAVRAGDVFEWTFTPTVLQITMNGKPMGTINQPDFARVLLATFIGPSPPTPRVKRELLGLGE